MKTKNCTGYLLFAAMVAGGFAGLGSGPAAAAAPDELEAAVKKIDMALYAQCEADVRAWLDARLAKYGDFGVFPDLPQNGHVAIDDDGRAATFALYRGGICDAGAQLFRAYEMLGDEKYLRAGLKTADALLVVQQPAGYFAYGPDRVLRDGKVTVGGGESNFIAIADGLNFRPFAYLLYAYRLSGEKKYFEAARRCADLFVEQIQHPEYGWCPEYGKAEHLKPNGYLLRGHDGSGGCYNDYATTDPLRMTIMMYHLTGEKKYLARSAKIGDWMFATQLGKGEVRGWCQQYKPDNTPDRGRAFEQAVIGPRTFNRCVGPMLTWFHGMTGEERYRKLFEETYRWMRSVEQPGDPGVSWARDQDELIRLYAEDFDRFVSQLPKLRHPSGGWAYQYQPDGTPIFSIRTRGYDGASFRYDQPEKWPRPGDIDQKNWAGLVYSAIHPSGRAKVQLDDSQQVLEVMQAGGLEALRDWYKGPKKLDSGPYLQARLEAARRCADTELVVPLRGRSLEEGVNGRVMGNYLERVRLRLARPDAPWLPAEGTLGHRK